MGTPILIAVTQDHIDNGVVGSASRCPVSLAVKDRSGCDRAVSNPSFIMGLKSGRTRFTVETPSVVIDFIGEFDREHKVEPFTFELEDI